MNTLSVDMFTQAPTWAIKDVIVRLQALQIDNHDCKLLAANGVDGECLPFLNEQALVNIGIPTFGRRVKIIKVVHTLLSNHYVSTLSKSDPGARPVSASPNSTNALNMNKTYPDSTSKVAANRKNNNSQEEKVQHDDDDLFSSKLTKSVPSRVSPVKQPIGRSSTTVVNRSTIVNNDVTDNESDIEEDLVESNFDDEDEEANNEDTESNASQTNDFKSSTSQNQSAASSFNNTMDDDDDLFATDEAASAVEFMAVKPWIGAIVPPSRPPKNNLAVPDEKLELEWVHGYRAFDSNTNLVYNSENKIVYPSAGVVIIYDPATKEQQYFTGHNDDVRCLAQHPKNRNIIASGQNSTIEKGKGTPCYACVWDSTSPSKKYVLQMTAADRAVRAITFSGDGKYVITVSNDDYHTIKIWNWEKKELICTAKGDTSPIIGIRANHRSQNEFVTVGKRHGVFWTFDPATNKLSGKRAQMGKDNDVSFFSAAYSEKGYACLGADNGCIYVFIQNKPARVFEKVHNGSILSLDWYEGGIISGGSDKICNIMDKRMEVVKKLTFSNSVISVHISGDNVLVGTKNAEVFEIQHWADSEEEEQYFDKITSGHSDGELWSLAMSPDGTTYVTAGEDNMVAVWDIASHALLRKAVINTQRGTAPKVRKAATTSSYAPQQCARAIAVSPDGKHIIIGCNNGEINVFDFRALNKLVTLDVNKYGKRNVTDQTGNWIEVISYSPSGNTCAVGTHGSVVALCDVQDGYKVKQTLKSSNSFLSAIDWSVDGNYIQTNDGAYELLFYSIDQRDLSKCKQVTNATSMRDVKWATQTCKFNWSVEGIFDASQNGQDVNSCDTNPGRTLVATGDDRGNVNIFRYPALKGNRSSSAHAHSSHVARVRFTNDGRHLISAGGHDLSVMQWRLA